MSVEIVDWLNASVVVVGSGLLATEEEIKSFSAKTSREVRYISQQGPDGTEVNARLEIMREKIHVDRNPERVAITKEYPDPSLNESWDRLVEVATLVLDSSSSPNMTARGYNVALVFDQDRMATADEFIGSNIFSVLGIPKWTLIGGQAALRFRDADLQGIWTVRIEPRVGTNPHRVFLALNLHLDGPMEEGEIRRYLNAARAGAISFLEVLR